MEKSFVKEKGEVLGMNVLVVDDDPVVREFFSSLLDTMMVPEEEDTETLISDIKELSEWVDSIQEQMPKEDREASDSTCSDAKDVLVSTYKVADSGKSALKLADKMVSENKCPDIVFCDIRMPGMDGVETTQKLLQKYPDLHVAFVSAFSDQTKETIEAKLGHPIVLIGKPFVYKDLKGFLEQTCRCCPSG